MSLIAALLPASFVQWLEVEVKARVVRALGLADKSLDLAERELEARHVHAGLPLAIEAAEPVDRLGENGRRKPRAKG